MAQSYADASGRGEARYLEPTVPRIRDPRARHPAALLRFGRRQP
jgi:hypothetical protein